MNEERNHEREQSRKETVREMCYAIQTTFDVAKKLGIDLTDEEQMIKYFESRLVSTLIQTEHKIRVLKRQQEGRKKILTKMQLANYEHELAEIKNQCDRFPKWLRIRLHRKIIDELSQKIKDYSNNENIDGFPKTPIDTAIANLERSMDTMYMSFRMGNLSDLSTQVSGIFEIHHSDRVDPRLLRLHNKSLEQQKKTELEEDE